MSSIPNNTEIIVRKGERMLLLYRHPAMRDLYELVGLGTPVIIGD